MSLETVGLGTLTIGIGTFVLSQLIVKMILDPVHDFKETVGEIQYWVLETSPQWNAKLDEAQKKELRKLATELLTQMNLVPWYPLTALLFHLPRKKRLVEASRYMIGFSLNAAEPKMIKANQLRMREICSILRIHNAWGNNAIGLSLRPDV